MLCAMTVVVIPPGDVCPSSRATSWGDNRDRLLGRSEKESGD